MSLIKLRLSIIGTLTLIIGISTLAFTILLTFFGAFNFLFLGILVVAFNLIQWLISPYLIDRIYRVKEITSKDNPKLYTKVRNLSQKMNLKMPRVMIANIPIPNAFAYSSPIAGSRIAVTNTLLQTLEEEEVEAVIGHELGHLKHRDVQIMMFASVLPAIFYYIGFSLLLSSLFGGYGQRRDSGGAALIGIASIAIYWVLSLFVLGLSRFREYYADRASVGVVENGSRKLSEALAKIVNSSSKIKKKSHQQISNLNSFKTLFISDPERADRDRAELSKSLYKSDQKLVKEILSKELTRADKILELFSTHPNIVKRLKALQKLGGTIY